MPTSDDSIEVSTANRGHVLLVSPLTFSYHLSISETLRSMGYVVTWWDDRASSSTWYKLALRLFPTYTVRWSEREFLAKLRQLDPTSISHVLVIKGEGLSRRVALEMRETLTSASMGLYLWDGVENVKGVSNILAAFDSVATFDPLDAKTFGWAYRPLFWRKIPVNKNVQQATLFDWCFVGTIHSDRHRVIHRLRQRGGPQVKIFVFAYFQSPLILLVRRLMDWTLWRAPKGTLSTKPMSAIEVAQKIECSKAVLDVEHPRQRGFTMRTIETLLAGKKLVTTNKHILKSNLYHPSRVHVISRSNPDISDDFLRQPFVDIDESIKRYYSCEGWASEILKLQELGKNNK
ncbi:hypothetical protein [Comamonas thiooxydans]|uniref:hypothetical protein n=1 Tax=Comamonas thiooxydans TaxID=363952 RepID=UPI0011852575|nr:hypothetical protein [Comamonas thiooxydans]